MISQLFPGDVLTETNFNKQSFNSGLMNMGCSLSVLKESSDSSGMTLSSASGIFLWEIKLQTAVRLKVLEQDVGLTQAYQLPPHTHTWESHELRVPIKKEKYL